jgi:hypothetical protein
MSSNRTAGSRGFSKLRSRRQEPHGVLAGTGLSEETWRIATREAPLNFNERAHFAHVLDFNSDETKVSVHKTFAGSVRANRRNTLVVVRFIGRRAENTPVPHSSY